MSFGQKLKQIRKTGRLTQQEMSKRLFMEQPAYSKYENDKIIPTSDIIKRVADAFDVSTDWLLQPEVNNVNFNEGSINNGAVIIQLGKYYAVPKDFMEAFIKQQQIIEELLQQLGKK